MRVERLGDLIRSTLAHEREKHEKHMCVSQPPKEELITWRQRKKECLWGKEREKERCGVWTFSNRKYHTRCDNTYQPLMYCFCWNEPEWKVYINCCFVFEWYRFILPNNKWSRACNNNNDNKKVYSQADCLLDSFACLVRFKTSTIPCGSACAFCCNLPFVVFIPHSFLDRHTDEVFHLILPLLQVWHQFTLSHEPFQAGYQMSTSLLYPLKPHTR